VIGVDRASAASDRRRLPDNETRVRETETLGRFSPRLEHNETRHQRHSITPTMAGERLRLIYLLDEGAPPGEVLT
jgi:hypothetical protein